MRTQFLSDLRIQSRIYFRILRYVKPYSGRMVIGMIASMIAGALGFSPVVLLNYLVDHILPSRDPEYLYVFCFALVAIYLIRSIADYTQSYMMSWVGQRIVKDLRVKLFQKLETLPLHYFRINRAGDLITRVISDIGLVELGITRVLSRVVLSFFSFFPPLIAIFWISWPMALISAFVLPITLYPILKFASKLKRASSIGQQQMSNLTSTMSETFYGIHIVKGFNMEDFELERFHRSAKDYYNASMRAARVSALSSPMMELIGALAAALVFGMGLQSVIQGEMTSGNLFSFVVSLFLMYDPIKKISSVNYDVQKSIAGAERLFEILDFKNTILDPEHPVPFRRVEGKIDFQNVIFSYQPGDLVLNDINFTILPGETIAVVGVSGAGKSTLANLIPRFFDPDSGHILIDDIDIKAYAQKDLRENIGIVTQETILFHDTVLVNISYGRNSFTRDQIISAAQTACAHEFIMDLPKGYDTIIGERGFTLSGGQRQRLAIARAILKNPPILILDEATSSLDSESESLIQSALEKLILNRTTLIIAHRLSTIRKSNKILVFDKGTIAEQGTHESLMNLKGLYHNMIERQMFIPQKNDR